MTQRPYVSFFEVKEKVPIPDVLAAFGIAEQFVRKGDTLSGVCPLMSHKHGPNPNPQQFKISCRDGLWLWHCFGDCQRGGDVIELVKGLTGYDNAHVRLWFAEKFGARLTLTKPKPKRSAEEKPPQQQIEKDTAREVSEDSPRTAPSSPSNLSAERAPLKPLRFRLNLDPDVPYLRQRGLSREVVERYGVGLCSKGMLKGYVAFPIHRWPGNEDENPVAHVGRWPGDEDDDKANRPRYKWPEEFDPTRVVFGVRQAMAVPDCPLVVVSDPLTVLHLASHGLPGAVATFAPSLGEEQANTLVAAERPIVLMFDGTTAGRAGLSSAAGKMICQTFVRVVKLPANTTPEQLPWSELAAMLS